MCALTVNKGENYGTATEKLPFKYDKSGATINLLHQQNPYMTSGMIFVTVPYYTIYYLLYQEFLTICAYP